MNQPNPAVVPVGPQPSPAMYTEPARTIGRQEQIRVAVAAVIALLTALGVNFAPGVPDLLTNVVNAAIPLALGVIAWWRQQKQTSSTREAVYSPATYDKGISDAVAASGTHVDAVIVPGPAVESPPTPRDPRVVP